MAVFELNTYTAPLIELAQRIDPKKILEVGYGYGWSCHIWLSCTKAHVTSVDKIDWPDKPNDPERFMFWLGDSAEVLPSLKDKFDLIYIDGDHRYEPTKTDIENAIPLLAKGGIMLLDDYGVTGGGGMTFDDKGAPVSGDYGVKQAADKALKGWKQIYKDIKFANGARAYVKA